MRLNTITECRLYDLQQNTEFIPLHLKPKKQQIGSKLSSRPAHAAM